MLSGPSNGAISQTGTGVIAALSGSVVALVANASISGGTLSTDGNAASAIETLSGNTAFLANLTNAGNFVGQDNSITFVPSLVAPGPPA